MIKVSKETSRKENMIYRVFLAVILIFAGTSSSFAASCSHSLRTLVGVSEYKETPQLPATVKTFEGFPHTPSREEIISSLDRVMPHFTSKVIHEKLQKSANPFMFFRGHVAYFFDIFLRNEKFAKRYSKLIKYRGWMFGDAHPENFALLASKKGDIRFVMADPDDSGPGPIFMEYMRLTVGAQLAGNTFNFKVSSKKMARAYLEGVEHPKKSFLLPKKLSKISKEISNGRKAKSKHFSKKKEQIIRESGVIKDATQKQIAILRKQCSELFPNAEFKDSAEVIRETGGSAFLKRYWVLLKFNSNQKNIDGPWQVIEFKQQAKSGINSLLLKGETPPSTRERVLNTWALSLRNKKDVPSLFNVVTIGGQDFYVRPKWIAYENIAQDELLDDFNEELMLHQARWLGQSHGKQINKASRSKYIKSVSEIKTSTREKDEEDFVDFYESVFKEISK